MAKLAEADIEMGRQMILDGDEDDIHMWVVSYLKLMNTEMLSQQLRKLIASGNRERAMKLFEIAVKDYDPAKIIAGGIGRAITFTVTTCAIIGGMIYFMKEVVGCAGN